MMIYVILDYDGVFIAAHENPDRACAHYEKICERVCGKKVSAHWDENDGLMLWDEENQEWKINTKKYFPTIQEVQLWI